MSSPGSPPPEVLAWIEREVGGRRRVANVRRMKGGVASVVHRVRLVRGADQRDVVLRWWPNEGDWHADAVRAEAAILTNLEQADIGVTTPRLLAVSAEGEGTGGRAVLLMDRLPGRVHLRPRDPHHWLRQVARTATRIHSAGVEAPEYQPWSEFEEARPPGDSQRPDLWRAAFSQMGAEAPAYVPAFVHRDYQHFNLLWVGEALSGVLDWSGACTGPADIDLGHCRLNLAVLFSAEWADDLLKMYESESGRSVDPWWDLCELLVYGDWWQGLIPAQVAGRVPVDVKGMTARVEAVIEAVLRRS